MKLFLRDNKACIFIYFFGTVLTLFYCELMNYIALSEIFYLILVNFFILLCFLAFRYYQTKEVYKLFEKGMNSIEESTVSLGNSLAGKNISKLFSQQYRLYEAKMQEYDKKQKDHLTFINTWVHQMKTPLSVIRLQLEEYEGEPLAENISEEVYKMDKNLNLALYFARMDAFEKDFVIGKINLLQLVLDTINNEKRLFIKSKVMPKVAIDSSLEVYTDSKWIKFIFNQIITNGVKYSKGIGKTLNIKAYIQDSKIILEIIDEGIGIPAKDIKRVFDPFFTGENGRKYGESTGMGLYIVKKICENLNHKVEIESEVGKGTKLRLIFSKIDKF